MRSLNQKAASCTKSLGKTAMQRYASPVHVDIVARSPLLPVAAGCLWSEEGMAKGVLPALQACRESAGDEGVCGSTGLFCMEGECAVDGAGPLVCGD